MTLNGPLPRDDVQIPLQQLADEVRDLRKVVEDVLRALEPLAQDVKALRDTERTPEETAA